jgi:hypothetical protein
MSQNRITKAQKSQTHVITVEKRVIMQSIVAYCMDWHIAKSPAFKNLLVEPLRSFANIELKAWDGNKIPFEPSISDPIIFCQLPPPPQVLEQTSRRVIWIPMWDMSRGASQDWWNSLPKSLHIVAFSEVVAHRAKHAGLRTLHLRYYNNPQMCEPITWNQGRVLLYWNRTGVFSPDFLARFCSELKIDKFLFRGQIDPYIQKQAAFDLPQRLNTTIVEEIPTFRTRDEYLRATSEANVFIAPRRAEGVGLAFLEAMARGCAVFAIDAPTMNEYITHKENGFLFGVPNETLLQHYWWAIRWRVAKIRKETDFFFSRRIDRIENWSELEDIDLVSLGESARENHVAGHKAWQQQIEAYAQFVLE